MIFSLTGISAKKRVWVAGTMHSPSRGQRNQKRLFRLILKMATNRIRFGKVISAISHAKVYV